MSLTRLARRLARSATPSDVPRRQPAPRTCRPIQACGSPASPFRGIFLGPRPPRRRHRRRTLGRCYLDYSIASLDARHTRKGHLPVVNIALKLFRQGQRRETQCCSVLRASPPCQLSMATTERSRAQEYAAKRSCCELPQPGWACTSGELVAASGRRWASQTGPSALLDESGTSRRSRSRAAGRQSGPGAPLSG